MANIVYKGGYIQSSGGSSGSIKFSLPVNQNMALTSSGYYFTDNIAGNIGIDCSQLGIGDHISWVNLSTKAVVFYGLATVNGTTIPANKGVRIEANTSIEFFLKDANFNARVLAGSYTVNWIPGQEPPFLSFVYVSDGDTNDIIHYFGTNSYLESYINPVTRGSIGSSVSSNLSGYPDGHIKLYDKSSLLSNAWVSEQLSEAQTHTIDFLTRQARITRFSLKGTDYHSPSQNGPNCLLQASNDNTNWINIHTFSATGSVNSWWTSPQFTNEGFYRYYRFYLPNYTYRVIGELAYYGDLSI